MRDEGWMAPEIEEKSMYSPIKIIPSSARSSMLQVAASLSNVANVAVKSKASKTRSPQG